MKTILAALALSLAASTASAQQGTVMWTWLSESGVAQIKIGSCPDAASGPICGYVANLINPKGPDGAPVAPDAATDYRDLHASLPSSTLAQTAWPSSQPLPRHATWVSGRTSTSLVS